MSATGHPIPPHARKRVGEIRHVILEAGIVTEGPIAKQSARETSDLAEIWFMPGAGNAFSPQILARAGLDEEEILVYCERKGTKERVLRQFFTNLPLADAEWHFETKQVPQGIVIAAVVGHPKAMATARELFDQQLSAATQHTVRRFAFESPQND